MSEYSATIKLKADRSGLTGELKSATGDVSKLNAELGQTGAAGASGAQGIKKHSTEAQSAANSSRKLSDETKSLRSQFLSLKGAIATLGIYTLGRQMYSTLAQFQDTRTMIKGLTDNAREYAVTQEYLIDVSDRYSGNLNTVSESYARMLALKKADIVTTGESRLILEGLLNAGKQLKASNEQLGLVYYGLAQGLSQATLQAQELNQVMEPLPGLLNYMDKAAGLTAGGFRRMVVDGEVTSAFFKTTLIQALENYDGAAARTYDNISSRSARISSQHQLLVSELEAPIESTIGGFLESYESGLRAVNANLPMLIEFTGDLAVIAVAVVAVKLSAWLFQVAAGSIAANGAFTALEFRMLATMSLARATTLAMTGLKASMAFFGGIPGVALLAGTALYAFGQNSQSAAERTAQLRVEIDDLAESFNNLTVAQLDQQIAEQQQAMNALATQRDALQIPAQKSSGNGPWGISAGMMQDVEAIQAYRDQLAQFDSELEEKAKSLAALSQARTQAVTNATEAESDAAAKLSELQQDLLDKYLPMVKLTREYHESLAALSAIETETTEQSQRKAMAIDALNAAYADEVKELTGVTKAEEDALKVREKTLQSMTKLIEEYAPAQNSVLQYETQLRLLTQARDEDLLSLENYQIAIAAVAQEYYDAANPGAVLIEQLQEELAALKLTGDELTYYTLTHGLSAEQIEKHGGAIKALVAEMRQEQVALDATEAAQKEYQQRTETMIDDLQRSWADYLDDFLRTGKFTFKSLGDSIVDIMRSTISRMASLDMANAFRGALTPSAASGASGTASTTGSAGTLNLGSLAAVVGGGVTSVLGASLATSSAPIYEGGKLISEGATALDFSLKNIGTNLFAGMAGGQLGTFLGESLFGKQAQSNLGATAGAVIGSMVPVVGTFLGAFAGGALDALFGGDGFKRSSVGFDTGRDSVRDSYYSGSETFASGLSVNKINRRGDAQSMDAIVAKAAEIDAFITNATRAAGGSLNLAGTRLSGTSADYGSNDGSFVGMRIGDGQDSEAALDAMFANFSTQLISHIQGIDEDVRQALINATGSADEILQQFQEALKLDQLVKSGALDILGDNISFTFAQQLADAAGGIDNLNAATSAFNASVADSAQAQQNVVERLRTAVGDQFAAINLTLSDFTSVNAFRDHFDQVKNSLEATDVLKLVQAGNALALLIEQEEQLVQVRAASMAEQLASAQEMFDTYKSIRTQATALAGTIQNDIYKLTGNSATDLRSRLRSGTFDEQLDVVDQLRSQILANYNEELQIKEQLHDQAMKNYEAQVDSATRIEDYIKGVMSSDISPLSVADRLTHAQAQFDDVVSRALAGDVKAGSEATEYFNNLAKLNQQANASSVTGVELFYSNLDKLQQVGAYLSQVQAPTEFSGSNLAAPYVAQLQELQAETIRIQNATAVDLVSGLGSLKLLLEQLPAKMALELLGVLPGALSQSLQLGANLGILSNDVRQALGLLPQASDLSSNGIATSIEAVTLLSQHPSLMAANITSLAGAMGAMMQQLVASGVSTHLLADTIAKNPAATAAANEYLAGAGLGSIPDYTSAVNNAYSGAQINDYVNSAIANAADEKAAVDAVMAGVIAGNIGSAQLAASTGRSQEEILALAAKYGYNSFDVGTDRVTHDQTANIHKDEIIFTPAESGSLRKAVIASVGSGGNRGDFERLVRAVETQSKLLDAFVGQMEQMSGEQQRAFAGASREISEAADRIARELEDRAA